MRPRYGNCVVAGVNLRKNIQVHEPCNVCGKRRKLERGLCRQCYKKVRRPG